ncbi:glutaredoxin family protein [Chitinimonas arctica]|uniref:Glutaredoxin family protein n=1 Tax=Chitinimonas arctica TaxID=2594795 RepID=A0A516SDW1_9NEIS|nr:glutaredoxin family protein [Chitinimonas arctica]QDQ26218.1 glutaredoxin family protein [Chitinimonas arctica]
MKLSALITLGLALALPMAHAAKVYSWKDASGNVVFSDQPQPGQKADVKDVKGNVVQTSGGNFITREAVRKNPVTLWINNCGDACDSARTMLAKRGVPYSLRNPQASTADYDQLKKLTGEAMVPSLQVGESTLKGFSESAWAAALDSGGYAKSGDPTLKGQQPAAAAAPAPAGTAPQPAAKKP